MPRKVIIDDYDTAAYGWTLSGYRLDPPMWRESYISIPGMDGLLDASTALTGEPQYDNRALEITLERSDGTRAEREAIITAILAKLDGRSVRITPPDRPDHVLIGRVHVARQYNDLAHAQVTVTASCAPWHYKSALTVVTRDDLGTAYKQLALSNEHRPVITTITVAQDTTLLWGGSTIAMSAGTHRRADIRLQGGANILKAKVASGTGSITVEYQEASL